MYPNSYARSAMTASTQTHAPPCEESHTAPQQLQHLQHPQYSADVTNVTEVFDPDFKYIYDVPATAVVHLPPARLNITRLVLCRNYRPYDAQSCAMGGNCKFVHAECDTAKLEAHPIHVNYIWRHESLCTYPRLPAGDTLTVWAPNNKQPATAVPSERVLVTKGSQTYMICLQSVRSGLASPSELEHTAPLSHCAHYYFNRMCNRGERCNFIHAVHVDPSVQGDFKRAPGRGQHHPPALPRGRDGTGATAVRGARRSGGTGGSAAGRAPPGTSPADTMRESRHSNVTSGTASSAIAAENAESLMNVSHWTSYQRCSGPAEASQVTPQRVFKTQGEAEEDARANAPPTHPSGQHSSAPSLLSAASWGHRIGVAQGRSDPPTCVSPALAQRQRSLAEYSGATWAAEGGHFVLSPLTRSAAPPDVECTPLSRSPQQQQQQQQHHHIHAPQQLTPSSYEQPLRPTSLNLLSPNSQSHDGGSLHSSDGLNASSSGGGMSGRLPLLHSTSSSYVANVGAAAAGTCGVNVIPRTRRRHDAAPNTQASTRAPPTLRTTITTTNTATTAAMGGGAAGCVQDKSSSTTAVHSPTMLAASAATSGSVIRSPKGQGLALDSPNNASLSNSAATFHATSAAGTHNSGSNTAGTATAEAGNDDASLGGRVVRRQRTRRASSLGTSQHTMALVDGSGPGGGTLTEALLPSARRVQLDADVLAVNDDEDARPSPLDSADTSTCTHALPRFLLAQEWRKSSEGDGSSTTPDTMFPQSRQSHFRHDPYTTGRTSRRYNKNRSQTSEDL